MVDSLKNKFATHLLSLSRTKKRLYAIAFDSVLILMVLWGSISFYSSNVSAMNDIAWWVYPIAVFVAIPSFIGLGIYHSVLKYFSAHVLVTFIFATFVSALLWFGLVSILNIADIPATIALVFWLGMFTVITGSRTIAQTWLYGDYSAVKSGKLVLIYGAGAAGTQLATVLKTSQTYCLAGFIDDDSGLKGWKVMGLNVYSPLQLQEIVEEQQIDEIILALPSAGRTRRQEIIRSLEPLPVSVRSVPAFADLATGKLQTTDIRDVDIDDLLGRDVIQPDNNLLPYNIENKNVLVTGAGGSIGSELCRQIIKLKPSKLILLEQSEFALYQIEQELEEIIKKNGLNVKLNKVLGSINNKVLLKRLFAHRTIQTIYHAAAYKHVPLVEENPVAGLENNVFGTKLLASIALEAHAETFILISTDKAVRPTNVMGCSKRVSEMVLQALALKKECKTIFSMVRFGNVLGSSGSVVPKFRQQIKEGGPITVTHKEITRFFMSIPEAVQLVIQAGAMAKGGDVFVLDMGEPVKISDLANKMIKLSGLTTKNEANPDGDIEIEYSGLRPGEKLYEELLIGDNVSGTQHKRIMRANEEYIEFDQLLSHLQNLKNAMASENVIKIKSQLTKFVSGYKPWIEQEPESEISKNKIISIK